MTKTNTKKVLFTSHTANFSKFNRPFMRWFKMQGYEVHYASAGEEKVLDCDKHFTVPFTRSPFNADNIKAYKQLKKIIDDEKYDIIHTHTPMGSVVTRLAARISRKNNGTRVIYTAHGFHFFKGAPLLNWLIYYPVEKWMSRYTDTLITINQEDFERAKAKFYTKKIFKIAGVGTDLKRFKPVSTRQKDALRKQHGFAKNDFILIYAAELNQNKNQDFLIQQIKDLQESIPNIKLLLCGDGDLRDAYKKTVSDLQLDDMVKLLGYRNDMDVLFQISDICVASSMREGLGINLVEAMATGLPIIASVNRGHREVIEHGTNGYLYPMQNGEIFRDHVILLHDDLHLAQKMSKKNIVNATAYSLQNALTQMGAIYTNIIKSGVRHE